jgi:uncharacterized membrane protein
MNFTEKFVLSVGLSISFLIFLGVTINYFLLNLNYNKPLTPISLLTVLNIFLFIFTFICYREFKDQFFSIPNINITIYEKAFLLVPILFPALSVFGTYVMNYTDNNLILMSMFFLIILYVIAVCFFNRIFPSRLYPVVIFLISVSLLLLLALRSNHIIGADTHDEYRYFINTLNSSSWHVYGNTLYDATLSISVLPVVYQEILNISPELLFKVLYSLLNSVTPLVIYILSRKYIEDKYAFLASVFFMFQYNFLMTAANSRTNIAILFFALSMMSLFNNKIDPVKKRILFIIFLFSVIVSHYSTAYIFFIITLGTYLAMVLLSHKYSDKKSINFTTVVLFFTTIFVWYSQITEYPFRYGIIFFTNSLKSLYNLFIADEDTVVSSGGGVPALVGRNIMSKGIPHKIQFISTWLTFILIGVGIITLIRYFKKMYFSESYCNMPDFLRRKFDIEYSLISLNCAILLILIVIVPYVATGYGITRLYELTMVVLSIFFVSGGLVLSKIIKTSPYIIILIILIPYFFSVTEITYSIVGSPRSIILNSDGAEFDLMYVHDQESYAANWIKENVERISRVYSDKYGITRLMSQAGLYSSDIMLLADNKTTSEGYIYLRYTAIVNHKLLRGDNQWIDILQYPQLTSGKNKIYGNGGSEVYG